MTRRARATAFVPLAVIALLAVAVPVIGLTESRLELEVKARLGLLDDPCKPATRPSPGWRAEPDLPRRRDEVRAVAAGGAIYLAGGIEAITDYRAPSERAGERIAVASLDDFRRFDPATGTYTELPALPARLNHLGLEAYDGDVYAVGGHGRLLLGADPRRDFYRFDTARRRWDRLPPMPTARGAFASAVVGDRLYVAGGQARLGVLRTLEFYDFGDRAWHSAPPMPSAREHVGGAAAGGYFYVVGGRSRVSDALRTVERYDPVRRRWDRLPGLPTPTGGLDAVGVEGRIVAVGGGDDTRKTVTGAVQRFDPHTRRWSRLAPMRTPRHGLGAAYADGRLYTFGGAPCAGFATSRFAESLELRR
jgi:hypothetical protein